MRFRGAVVRLGFGNLGQQADIERSRVCRAQRGLDPEIVPAGGSVLVHAHLDQYAVQGVDVFDRSAGETLGAENRLVGELDDVRNLRLQAGMAELDRAGIRQIGALNGHRDRLPALDACGGDRRNRRGTHLRQGGRRH